MDKEDYFDKYFQMDTILIIFFYKYIILVLNSRLRVPKNQSKIKQRTKCISQLIQLYPTPPFQFHDTHVKVSETHIPLPHSLPVTYISILSRPRTPPPLTDTSANR